MVSHLYIFIYSVCTCVRLYVHTPLMLCISGRALQFCSSLALPFASKSNPCSRALEDEDTYICTSCARAECSQKPSLRPCPANCSLLFFWGAGELLWVCCKVEKRAPRGYQKVRRQQRRKQDGIALEKQWRQCTDLLGRR